MERRVPGHRTECKLRHKEAPQGRVSVRGPEARCGDGSQEEGGPMRRVGCCWWAGSRGLAVGGGHH